METNVYWLWLLSMGSLIFLMQAGFFLLEGGQVRSRDVANVMMKMTGHMGIGIVVFPSGYFFLGRDRAFLHAASGGLGRLGDMMSGVLHVLFS